MGLSLDLTPHEMRQRISSSGKPFSALTASLKIATELGSGWKREKLFLHICLNLQVSDVRQSLCAAVPDRPMLTTRRNAKCISRRQRDSSAKPPARGDAEQGTARWYPSHPHAAWLTEGEGVVREHMLRWHTSTPTCHCDVRAHRDGTRVSL